MTTVTEQDRARIAARYPKPRTPHWLVVALVAIVALALGGYWVRIAAYHANPGLEAKVSAFEVRSPTRIDVQIMVDRPDPSKAGTCLVYAQAVTYERVAEQQVVVPPMTNKVDYVSVSLQTYREATSASVEKCRLN